MLPTGKFCDKREKRGQLYDLNIAGRRWKRKKEKKKKRY
jgi:hypothetical protein